MYIHMDILWMSIRQPMDVDVDWTWIGYVDYNYVNVCHGSV